MTISLRTSRQVFIAWALSCSVSVAVHAQQAPITGQMLAPAAPSAAVDNPAPPAAAAPAPTTSDNANEETQVGSTTRQLLSMQALGTHAGKHLSIPGPEASASYQRYLKSFEHPIPEFYDAAVSKSADASSNSSSP